MAEVLHFPRPFVAFLRQAYVFCDKYERERRVMDRQAFSPSHEMSRTQKVPVICRPILTAPYKGIMNCSYSPRLLSIPSHPDTDLSHTRFVNASFLAFELTLLMMTQCKNPQSRSRASPIAACSSCRRIYRCHYKLSRGPNLDTPVYARTFGPQFASNCFIPNVIHFQHSALSLGPPPTNPV